MIRLRVVLLEGVVHEVVEVEEDVVVNSTDILQQDECKPISVFFADLSGTLKRQLNKVGVMKQLHGRLLSLLPKPIAMKRKRKPMNLPLLLKKTLPMVLSNKLNLKSRKSLNQ